MSKGEYEMKGRLSRGSSLFSPDPQVQLLQALQQKDIRTFKKLLGSGSVDADFSYGHPDYKTCLEIACSEKEYSEYVSLLLQHNVNINKINETHRRAPLHFAVETGDLETIKVLLEDSKINSNAQCKGNTALHLAIKKINDIDDDREQTIKQYEEITEILLKSGTDANIPDFKGITPIYSAAKQGLERIVQLIIEYSKTPVDLDSYKDWKGKTARDILENSFPYLLDRIPSKADQDNPDIHKLFNHLNNHNEDKFINDLKKLKKSEGFSQILQDNNGLYTLLQSACKKGMERATDTLLQNGANPNATAPGNSMRPIALACSYGYHKVLKLLEAQESTTFEPVNGDSLLQIVIKESKKALGDPNVDYHECFKILMDSPKAKTNPNYLDIKNNTALHYATRGGDQEKVLELLKKGACIGLRNRFNEPPLADMSAKTLEEYLDSCLTTNNERPNDEDYELKFNYSFLVPPRNEPENEAKVPLMDDSNVSISCNDKFLAPETDALLYMTQVSEFKPLLKHPVITSFLYLKWLRISYLFYANITFYSLFWLSLIFYILLVFNNTEEISELGSIVGQIAYVTTIIGWIILVFRELSQMAVAPKKYWKSFENWIEFALILVVALILFRNSTTQHSKQELAAIAILFSSAELVLLIGNFPTLSTYFVMLKTVSWNFFKFLLWYFILIIAFALCFYSLFRTVKDENETVPYDPNKNQEEEPNFFESPGLSLFKTIVMLTGELEATDIRFESFPVISHIIFALFVFMIPIVLFNLLNGLAVSDTQAIKENAELVGHISRIKLISYFENVLLGEMGPYRSAISNMQNACCWLPGGNCVPSRMICIKPLARRICLFPNFLPMAQIGVKINKSSQVIIYTSDRMKKKQDRDEETPTTLCCWRNCDQLIMDGKVVKRAKLLIAEKESGGSEIHRMQRQLENCEKKLESFQTMLEQIYESVKL